MCNHHTRAFTLLEILLVLVCIAVIVSWAMHHYKINARRAQVVQIQSDIKSLQRALDSFLHTTGCDKKGNLHSEVIGTDLCGKLQQSYDVVCSRPPVVTKYVAKILNSTESTKTANPKPIYPLEIQAALDPTMPKYQRDLYRQELHAKADPGSTATLYWDGLPNNSYVQLGDGSWVLNGSSLFFHATQEQQGDLSMQPDYTGSFCAN